MVGDETCCRSVALDVSSVVGLFHDQIADLMMGVVEVGRDPSPCTGQFFRRHVSSGPSTVGRVVHMEGAGHQNLGSLSVAAVSRRKEP